MSIGGVPYAAVGGEIWGNAEKRDWGERQEHQAGGNKPLSERIHSYVEAKGGGEITKSEMSTRTKSSVVKGTTGHAHGQRPLDPQAHSAERKP